MPLELEGGTSAILPTRSQHDPPARPPIVVRQVPPLLPLHLLPMRMERSAGPRRHAEWGVVTSVSEYGTRASTSGASRHRCEAFPVGPTKWAGVLSPEISSSSDSPGDSASWHYRCFEALLRQRRSGLAGVAFSTNCTDLLCFASGGTPSFPGQEKAAPRLSGLVPWGGWLAARPEPDPDDGRR